MIEIQNLSVSHILRDVSLTLTPGTVTVLLGPNGAGKSTLLACIAGLRKYTGDILLNGEPLKALSPARRAQAVALLPQKQSAPEIPVEALARFGRAPYGSRTGALSQADREKAAAALHRAGLSDKAHRLLSTLSGGELQRAWFAMVLSQDAPVLLLDEPASHLDATASDFLPREILALKQEGKTILCVMHDVSRAAEIADFAAILKEGKLLHTCTGDELRISDEPARLLGLRRYTASGEDGEKVFFR